MERYETMVALEVQDVIDLGTEVLEGLGFTDIVGSTFKSDHSFGSYLRYSYCNDDQRTYLAMELVDYADPYDVQNLMDAMVARVVRYLEKNIK